MKIIDLSKTLYDHMPVYPRDPDVVVEQIQTFDKDGWNMKRIQINLHDGTHVNVPIHGTKNGLNLDSYKIDSFFGKSELYKPGMKFYHNKGVIFSSCNIDQKIAKDLIKFPPKFIGLSEKFTFYGVPLNIKEADGSPVRAFAIV